MNSIELDQVGPLTTYQVLLLLKLFIYIFFLIIYGLRDLVLILFTPFWS